MDYVGPRIISSTGWKQPSLSLAGIYKRWKSANPKVLNWFINFLNQTNELTYNTLSTGEKAVLKDFGFDVNVLSRSIKVPVPPYRQNILKLTGGEEESELDKLREELRKCRETKKTFVRDEEEEEEDTPPPVPEEKKKALSFVPPTPPPAPVYTKPAEKKERKNPTPPKVAVEEPKSNLFDIIKGRRRAINGEEEEEKSGFDDDDVDARCIICSNISFTECECCSEIYCSQRCQKINHDYY